MKQTRLFLPVTTLAVLSLGGCYIEDPENCEGCTNTPWPDQGQTFDDDGDGFSEASGDCDDHDASVHPFALDDEDGKDNDCDGQVDEDAGATPAEDTPGNPPPPTPGDPPPTPDPDPVEEEPDDVIHPDDPERSQMLTDLKWIGDLDGDGISDFAASASYLGEGQVYLYYGRPGGFAGGTLSEVADAVIVGFAAPDTNGIRLGTGGDVNGDGKDDLLIGDVYHRRVSLMVGASTRLTGTLSAENATATFYSYQRGGYALGLSQAIVPDMDGDGKDEIALGIPAYDWGRGAVAFYYGGDLQGDLDVAGASAWLLGINEEDAAGGQVFGSKDLDGDGLGELLVLSTAVPQETGELGAVSVLYGHPNRISGDLSLGGMARILPPARGTFGGLQLACGDFDADGWRDLAFGIPLDGSAYGSVYLLFGQAQRLAGDTTIDTLATRVMNRDETDIFFGSSVSLGDVTGDGIDDLLITSPLLGPEEAGEGEPTPSPEEVESRPGYAVILRGGTRPAGSLSAGTDAWGYVEGESLGFDGIWPAMAGGDVNADGRGDYLVGASLWSSAGTSSTLLIFQ